ncbi:MAG: hypothetical protein KDI42_01765 [Gammaproteobacteria bacterium]|nr:hypothetical protein [Gammaproteobacteria bacterium]
MTQSASTRNSTLRLIIETLIALLLLVLVAQNIATPGSSVVGTEFQAVVLDSGQIYIGRLEKLDTGWPVMRDVIQIARRTQGEGQPPQLVLVPRAAELHRPDHMVLNATRIQSIEPVSPDSPMMQQLNEAMHRGATPETP